MHAKVVKACGATRRLCIVDEEIARPIWVEMGARKDRQECKLEQGPHGGDEGERAVRATGAFCTQQRLCQAAAACSSGAQLFVATGRR